MQLQIQGADQPLLDGKSVADVHARRQCRLEQLFYGNHLLTLELELAMNQQNQRHNHGN